MTKTALTVLIGALLSASPNLVLAQDEAPSRILFTNVNVFDGTGATLQERMSVLVEGNLIKTISSSAIQAPGATMIDGGGRTLMPGLVDLHSHLLANGDAGLVDIDLVDYERLSCRLNDGCLDPHRTSASAF